MNKTLQSRRSLRKQRKNQRTLEQWEKTRARGKARYVFGSAIVNGLTIAGVLDVIDNVLRDGTQYSLASNLILYSIIGVVAGFVSWWDMEGRYKAALIDARVKASPSGKTWN